MLRLPSLRFSGAASSAASRLTGAGEGALFLLRLAVLLRKSASPAYFLSLAKRGEAERLLRLVLVAGLASGDARVDVERHWLSARARRTVRHVAEWNARVAHLKRVAAER
jgi:hypothetical protein